MISVYHEVIRDLPEDNEPLPRDRIASLRSVKARRLAYLQIALVARAPKAKKPALSHAEYRLLVQLALRADADLSGSFPSLFWLTERTGFDARYLRRIMQALVDKGWLRRVPRRYDDGGLRSAVNQFCVPADALSEGSPAWVGP